RRAGAGVRDVRPPAVRVGEGRAVVLDDRLAAERVTPGARRRGVIVDRERAKLRRRLFLAVAEVRLFADEVLALHLPPRHAGVDAGDAGVDREAEAPIPLLEPPGGAIAADPRRHDPVLLPRLPHRVPERETLLHRHVELPAEVADVRDPRRDRAVVEL